MYNAIQGEKGKHTLHYIDFAIEADLGIQAWISRHHIGSWVISVIQMVDGPLTIFATTH